jgi:glycogen debranching enzyme
VLAFMAATQADSVNPLADAEPGKIFHEFRQGELAATGQVPYARYYGSVDSTPLYVMLAGEYFRMTGDLEFVRELWPSLRRALEWMDKYGDADGDGFVEYASNSPHGLTNQGWKDSRDSVFWADGGLASPPIALCEVQGYVYAARRGAAEIAAALGEADGAAYLNRQADTLRDRFATTFWDEQLGLYVEAIDGQRRPCRVATSNSGQVLFTGIAREDHARRIIDDMLSPRFFSGWGIRTVATDQPRYNPMSYHNGSIWPHDTAIIAAGMSRCGRPDAAARIMSAMMDASCFAELYRLPELFCGFPRRPGEGPIRYPVACAPQSWAAGAVFQMLGACLGLSIRPLQREVVFQNPTLPEWLQFVELKNLRVGTGTADLIVQRRGNDLGINVLRRDAGIRVVLTH